MNELKSSKQNLRKRGIKHKNYRNIAKIILPIVFVGIFLFVFIEIFSFSNPPITGHWSKGGSIYECINCTDCTEAILNATSGDTVKLTISIPNVSGSCINFSGADNVTFDCQNYGNYIQGDNLNSDMGISLPMVGTNASLNNTITNCNISYFNTGISISSSSNNNTLLNIISSNNTVEWGYGIRISGSYNNLSNIMINNNTYGIVLEQTGDFNQIRNLISKDNKYYGLWINGGDGNDIQNVTIVNNSYAGIYLITASLNNIINSKIADNTNWDIQPNSCDNNFTNISSSNGYYIEFYNNTAIIQNKTLSELILCSALFSDVKNITIISSTRTRNNGIYAVMIDRANFSEINSSFVNAGIYFLGGGNNTVINSTFNNNSGYGINLGGSNNTIINITANFNYIGILTTTDGFLKADGLTANNNSYLGMDITLYAEDRNITNSIFKDNAQNDIRFTRSVSCKISLINVTGTGNQPIGFNYSSNISIENQTFSSLTICHAQNVTIKNVTIIGSSSLKNGEFNLYDVNNSYLIDVNASDLFYALYLTASYKNIISNSTFFRSFIPVTLSGSEKNNITNISVKWGSSRPDGWIYGAGIYLAGAHNNTIKDSQIRHNYKEAIYFLSSHQNNITNCIIENHSNGGLKFSGGSKKNVIYNNFLNNSLNYNDTTSVSNYFNITKTLGTNIVGGAYLGGNYWGDVNETGFSEIGCTDENQDNICDAVYPLGDGNYDYLPLTLISFTLPEVVVVSHGDSPAPGASQTSFLGSISSGGSATMEITNPKISITKVTVEVKDMVTGVSLTVMEISSPTQAGFEIGLPSGISYQTFEVSAIGLINENISKLIFNFRINNTWLEKQNKSVNDVNLYRKPTNMTEWSPLTTTYIGKDEKYSYFSALSPGFSSFLIFVSPAECIPAEKRCLENQAQFCLGNKKWLVSEVCDYKCEKGKCIEKGLQINLNPLVVYPIIGIVVVGVLVSFIIQRRIKMKQKISSSEAYNQYFDNIKPSEN